MPHPTPLARTASALPQADASTLLDRDRLEQHVRDVYRRVASEPGSSRHFETGRSLALRLGYRIAVWHRFPPRRLPPSPVSASTSTSSSSPRARPSSTSARARAPMSSTQPASWRGAVASSASTSRTPRPRRRPPCAIATASDPSRSCKPAWTSCRSRTARSTSSSPMAPSTSRSSSTSSSRRPRASFAPAGASRCRHPQRDGAGGVHAPEQRALGRRHRRSHPARCLCRCGRGRGFPHHLDPAQPLSLHVAVRPRGVPEVRHREHNDCGRAQDGRAPGPPLRLDSAPMSADSGGARARGARIRAAHDFEVTQLESMRRRAIAIEQAKLRGQRRSYVTRLAALRRRVLGRGALGRTTTP